MQKGNCAGATLALFALILTGCASATTAATEPKPAAVLPVAPNCQVIAGAARCQWIEPPHKEAPRPARVPGIVT